MKTYTVQDIERFYKYVAVGKPDECWEWFGHGYKGRGLFWFDRHEMAAARFAWWIHTGHWPGDLCVCHHCDNMGCVNAAHLFLGTKKENSQDSRRKGRRQYKLTPDKVREIREKFAAGMSPDQLAAEYGISTGPIYSIINRKTWTHVK